VAETPSLHRALYAYLSLYTPLQSLVHTRIFPSVAPSSAAFPFVTVQRLAVDTQYHMSGASGTFATLVQIDCWALQAGEAKRLADVIRGGIDAFAGTWDGLEIDGAFIDSELDTFEPAQDGSERMFHRTVLTVQCWHERALPAWGTP
jgi:hypothetical protein